MNSPRKSSAAGRSGASDQNAIELLKADHREVEQLFEQFQSAKGRQQRKKVIKQIAVALTAHAIIEEEIFYPACSEHGVEEDDLDEAQVEHDTVKLLVRELLEGSLDDDYYDAKVTVLSEYVKHHVKEEEEPKEGIFARVQKSGLDLDELGQELQERKEELMEDEDRLTERPPRLRSLSLGGQQRRQSESRQSGRGEEDWGPTGRPRSSDRQGREAGASERGDYAYRSERGERGDDDRRRGYGAERDQGHGGWYGDPRGHSEASRRGWRHRDH